MRIVLVKPIAAVPVLLASAALTSGCSAHRRLRRARQRGPGRGGLHPSPGSPSGSAGGDVEVENLTAPGGEPHDLEPTVRETAGRRAGRPGRLRARLPARGRRHRGRERRGRGRRRRAGRRPRALPRPRVDSPEDDPTSGGTRCSSPTSGTPWRSSCRRRPRARERLPGERRHLARRPRAARPGVRRGLADCERDTVVVSHDAFGYPQRYGLTMETIPGLPRLRADPRPTRAPAGPDPHRGRHHGLLRVAGQRRRRRPAGPGTPGAQRRPDPIEA